ncbi:MAG: hypothetical protein UMR38_06790 [Candidatus Izemoplasma sp.]|nr:hypothetical protein [Candidatus Izemoplasma sp.]
MAKFNRPIDPEEIKASKQRTMAFVMDEIDKERIPLYKHIFHALFQPKRLALVASAIVIALIILFNPGTDSPPIDTEDYQISTTTSDQLAELSYISSHLVAMDMTVSNTDILFLANTTTTALEDNMHEFNQYFDMLRVYLDDAPFEDATTFNVLSDSEYQYEIIFEQENLTYTLRLNAGEDGAFTGIMTLDGITLDVTGSIEESNTETKFEFDATNGTDTISIEYETEVDNNESEKSFVIETNINNVVSEKDITVEKESDEWTVKMTDNDDTYELKKELEDGIWQYKLEYEVGHKEGEARITETTDINGNAVYQYHISEEGIERDVEVGKPDFDKEREKDSDNETDDDTSSEQSDNDDSPGHEPDDNPSNRQDQSYDKVTEPTQLTV